MNYDGIIVLSFLFIWIILSSVQGWALFHAKGGSFPLVVVVMLFVDLGVIIERILDDGLGCESPVAYASTISRISASIVPQGYAFMMVSLSLLTLLFLRELSVITSNRQEKFGHLQVEGYNWTKVGEAMIRFGFGLTLLTAVLPDLANNASLEESGKAGSGKVGDGLLPGLPPMFSGTSAADITTALANLHLLGIQVGIVISTLGSVIRYRFTLTLLGSSWRSLGYIRLSVVIVSGGIVCLLCFMGLFVYNEQIAGNAALMHICTLYTTKRQCEGGVYADRNLTLADDWPCEWNAAAPFTRYACTNPRCEDHLYINRNALSFEYLLLLYWILVCSSCLRAVYLVEVTQYYSNQLPAESLLLKDENYE